VTCCADEGILPPDLLRPLLDEHARSVRSKLAELAAYPPSTSAQIFSVAEAQLLLLATHLSRLVQCAHDGVDYVEELLRWQLIAAIGKEVLTVSVVAMSSCHSGYFVGFCAIPALAGRRMFAHEFWPLPFSYAVRRPDHAPEGVISLEELHRSAPSAAFGQADPILTSCCSSPASSTPICFALDACTEVSVLAERHLHGWMASQFGASESATGLGPTLKLQLTARARPFSTFIVLVGRIASANLFEPSHAVVVRNKDEWTVPLQLEAIPTAKVPVSVSAVPEVLSFVFDRMLTNDTGVP
jgi:hypothetical protein